MTAVAVIRPEGDTTERTLSLWADLVLPPGGLPNVNVVTDLQGPVQATSAAASAALRMADVTLYFGHAHRTSLGVPVIIDGSSIANARRRVVIAIACLSADTLGPDAVAVHRVTEYLGFSEPLFVYDVGPAVSGAEIAKHLAECLKGTITLSQARADIIADLQTLERLYCSGALSRRADATMIWMGVRMNWRGLELH